MTDNSTVRQPQHQGVFYPANPELLNRQLDDCLAQAVEASAERIKAIVVPHAGYDYSARVAALAYAALQKQSWVRRVVIFGPNHQSATTGALICSHEQWITSLGKVKIDQVFMQQHWGALPDVVSDDEVHQAEYSIEVQLPFLQRVLPDVPMVPVLLSYCEPADIKAILQPVWECDETLIIVSSDLYHYLPRESALSSGRAIARAIEQNDTSYIRPETACGYVALGGLMSLAAFGTCYWRTLTVQHSAQDNRFMADNLVGYGAFLLLSGNHLSFI